MIPILYRKDETDFTHHGLGNLADTIKATVTEERNGAYELALQYPVTGRYFSMIEDAIIKAKANDTSDAQLFRVYKSTKPLKGIVTFYAEHISYDLNGLPLAGFSCAGTTPLVAINKALDETPLEHSFSAWSDIAALNGTKIKEPPSVRGLLGGQEGSILDVWGGEYEFDNFTIKLHAHRGADNGVSIEYGKNLTDIKQERNISECYTHIMPYAVYTRDDGNGNSEEVYVYLTERVLALPNAPNLGHYRAFRYDCSGEFGDGEVPTESKIRALTNRYIASHDLITPKVNITVSFINLADTVEYKNIAPLERVRLCDTVTVKFSKLGINASAKVIKTVYNVLNEKYESVTVGDAKSSFADTVNKQSSDMAHVVTRVAQDRSRATIEIENAIARATAAITGQSGGYVVHNPSENPQEILLLDAASGGDIENAVNVWRWNSGGLGHSSTGYEGTYSTAITYDGKIVADFIAAGTLNGTLLRAGSVEANAISSSFKQSITDEIGGTATTLRQEFAAADGQLRSAISAVDTTLSTYYSTTVEMQSAITQTANAINLEVAKKVNTSDFGTQIQLNYDSVRIAWNNNSNYIKFENGELNIYNNQATPKKLISFNQYGEYIYYGNDLIGGIGTSVLEDDPTMRALSFNLTTNAAYMGWFSQDSDQDTTTKTKLLYARQNIYRINETTQQRELVYEANRLHAGCDMDMNFFKLRDAVLDNWRIAGGAITDTVTVGGYTLNFKNGILISATYR